MTKTITLQMSLASLQGPSCPMLHSVVSTSSSLTPSTPEKVHHTDTSLALHMCTQCITAMLVYHCVCVCSTMPLTSTLITSPSTPSQVLPPNPPTSTTAPVWRPTLGARSDVALMTTGVAVTTLTDHTASTTAPAGAGAGTEAVIEAPGVEVPTSPMKLTVSRVLMCGIKVP
jgi:hypothetical protein